MSTHRKQGLIRRAGITLALGSVGLIVGPIASSSAQSIPWSPLAPASSPPARSYAGTAFDSALGKIVLFGGGGNGLTALNDTWTYDGANWARQTTPASPSPREAAAMAYDPATGQVVLFGGFVFKESEGPEALGETWTFDGSTWTHRTPLVSPSKLGGASMAYDAASGQLILFGGFGEGEYRNETWSWNGSEWVALSPATKPPARNYASMAYDEATQKVVLFGGIGEDGSTRLGDTWTYNGSTWTKASPSTSPSARYGAAMAFDPSVGQMVLFGGSEAGETGVGASDTWTWDGSTWARQTPPRSPSGREAAALAFDAPAERLILFGGDEPQDEVFDNLGDTWVHGSVSPPSATIVSPGEGGTYTVGESVPTSFKCEDGAGMPGIESCTDSRGSTSGAGQLDTSTPGTHTYSVLARSKDGETASASITYSVASPVSAVASSAPPSPPSISPPVSSSTPGVSAPKCRVPALDGKTLSSAKKLIRAAGCAVGKVTSHRDGKAKVGKVVDQSPRPKVKVPSGRKIDLTVGS